MTDVLERAKQHLFTMAPHVKERLTAQLLSELVKELELILSKHKQKTPGG